MDGVLVVFAKDLKVIGNFEVLVVVRNEDISEGFVKVKIANGVEKERYS